MHVKTPAVAGLFYPGTEPELRNTVDRLMQTVSADSEVRPHALIAPHAGYQYSGPIAANAYASLRPWAAEIRHVAVLAPSHRVPFRGIALSNADAFQTPLGAIPVDTERVKSLAALPHVGYLDAAFAEEHALEVQLPFLQRVLDDFILIPLIVGDAEGEDVARVIEALVADDILIVVSSDLSHYHGYAEAQQRDANTTGMIEAMQADDIGPYDACGAYPIRGLLKAAQHHGWHVKTLDLRNSGDTAGDKSRVVGYGAYEFY